MLSGHARHVYRAERFDLLSDDGGEQFDARR
jgi:hypothetical protein